MADSGLDLLFRLKAQNQATPAIKSVQADVAKLRQTFGSDFNQMKAVSTTAISSITSSLSGLTGRVPVLGGVLNSLTSQLTATAGATTQTGASLAALGGPLGIAIAGFAATAVGVAALAKGLFDLAVQTAEYQGKLFDMSQQTGVSVETLSALEIVAKTTGGSIESISQSLVIFQGHLDEAQDSSSKAGKQFQELGISIEDTETAFRDALKSLAAMPEGFHQTNEAAELFGRRGGKQVLAILKELDGDLDGAIQRFKEFGLVTTAEAKAADEFNDQLTLLQFQLRGLSGVIGKEVIPQALSALKDLQQALKDNKDAIDALGLAAKITAGAIGLPLKGALFLVSQELERQRPFLQAIINLYERAALAAQKIRPPVKGGVDFSGSVDGLKLLQEAQEAFKSSQQPFDLRDLVIKKDKGAAKDLKAALDEQLAVIRDAISDRTGAFQAESEDLERELKKRQIAFDAYIKKARDANDSLLASTLENLKKEREAVDAALASRVIKPEEAAKKLRAIDNAEAQARREAQKEQQRLDDALQAQVERRVEIVRAEAERIIEIQQRQSDASLRIADIADGSRIALIRALADVRIQTEEETANKILRIQLDANERERNLATARYDAVKNLNDRITNDLNTQRAAAESRLQQAGAIIDPTERLTAQRNAAKEIAIIDDQRVEAAVQANKEEDAAWETLLNNLKIIFAQREALQSQGERDIEAGRQQDLANQRQYADELEDINQRIRDIGRDTAQEVIRSMIQNFARRTDIIRAQAALDIKDAEDRHRRNQLDINRQRATVRERIASIDSQVKSLESAGKHESRIYENAVNARISALAQQEQLNDQERASLTQHQAILTALRSQNVIQDYQRAIQGRVTALEKQKDLNSEEQEELRQHQAILQSLREQETRSDRAGIIQARISVLEQQKTLNSEERDELARHQAELKSIRESEDLGNAIERRIAVLTQQKELNTQEQTELRNHYAVLAAIRGRAGLDIYAKEIEARVDALQKQKDLNKQEQEELRQNQAILLSIRQQAVRDDRVIEIQGRIDVLERQKTLNEDEKAELQRHQAELKQIREQGGDLQSVIQKRVDFLRAQTVLNDAERAELARHEAILKTIRGTGQSFESALRARIKFLEAQETLNAQELEELKQNRALVAAVEDRGKIYQDAVDRRIIFLEQQKGLNDQEIAELERLRAEKKRIGDQEKKDEALAGPGGGFVTGLETGQLAELENGVQSFADVAKVAFSAVGAVVGQLAQGVGELVNQWVLLGNNGPNAFRKLVASVLAGVAAQAAVLAVMELAYGIAALTPWGAAIYGPAPAHFQAAALFGSIAAVAAVAGRGVAGGLFKTKEPEKPSRDSSDALQTIVQGRNQPQPVNVTINLRGDDSKLASFITASVVQNIGDGGEIREVLATDGR